MDAMELMQEALLAPWRFAIMVLDSQALFLAALVERPEAIVIQFKKRDRSWI